MGVYYCYIIPQPLQTVLVKNFDISNKEYTFLFSAFNMPNILLTGMVGVISEKIGEYKCLAVTTLFFVVG
jgi:hypothetical protein